MRNFPWLSISLLLAANVAFGMFLRDLDLAFVASRYVWVGAIAYTVLECGVLSIYWSSFQQFVLRGFQSDVGYTLSALFFASFAVVVVVWVHIFGHFLVMLAAALLLRIDLFTRRIGTLFSFILLLMISGTGLAISWFVPTLYPL